MYPKRSPGYMIWLQEGWSCMPRGFRDTWYDCKKASHVSQQVSGIHDMAARRLVMYPNRFPGYMI